MSQFGNGLDQFQRARTFAGRVVGLADEHGAAETDAPDAMALENPESRVEHDAIGFGYESRRIPDGVGFVAASGETVALVGSSGSGTSTVPNFPEAVRPRRRVDRPGRLPGRNLTRDSIRRSVGYAGQEPFAFHDTVREDLVYGAGDPHEEAVVEVA